MTSLEKFLSQVEATADAATKGVSEKHLVREKSGTLMARFDRKKDASFYATACTAIPTLVALVRALVGQRDHYITVIHARGSETHKRVIEHDNTELERLITK